MPAPPVYARRDARGMGAGVAGGNGLLPLPQFSDYVPDLTRTSLSPENTPLR